MIVQGSSNNRNANLFAWTIVNVDWSKYDIDSSLDSYLHRAIIRHGELENMSYNFLASANDMKVKVSRMCCLTR
jgi:hypothetical protein